MAAERYRAGTGENARDEERGERVVGVSVRSVVQGTRGGCRSARARLTSSARAAWGAPAFRIITDRPCNPCKRKVEALPATIELIMIRQKMCDFYSRLESLGAGSLQEKIT